MSRKLNSSMDMLGVVAELNMRRMADVLNRLGRHMHGRLELTRYDVQRMAVARMLHHEYLTGDDTGHYEHTDQQQDIILDLMQWLIEKHIEMSGHRPEKPAEFNKSHLSASHASQKPPSGSYRKLLHQYA